MKQQETKYINGVPVARIQDYGYRDYSILLKIWKVISNILVITILIYKISIINTTIRIKIFKPILFC